MTEPVVRPLVPAELDSAIDLTARAFHNEPFIASLFGAEPTGRFGRTLAWYRAHPWPTSVRTLGAFRGPALLGYVSWYPAGACHLCLDTDPNRPPADAAAQGEWRFSVTRRAAHLTQGEHAWIHRVAVEPIVQGCGVGRLLVEAAVEAARTTRSPCVLLECEQHREPFYLARGFHRATSFPDSLGPDVSVMRRAL